MLLGCLSACADLVRKVSKEAYHDGQADEADIATGCAWVSALWTTTGTRDCTYVGWDMAERRELRRVRVDVVEVREKVRSY